MACNFIYDLESRSPTPASKTELNELWTDDASSDGVPSTPVAHSSTKPRQVSRTIEDLRREMIQHYFNITLIPKRDRFPYINLSVTDSLVQRKINRLLYQQNITKFLSCSETELDSSEMSDSTCRTPLLSSDLLTSIPSCFPSQRRRRLGVIYSSDSET